MSLTPVERRDLRIVIEKKEVIVSPTKEKTKEIPKTKRQELQEYLKSYGLD